MKISLTVASVAQHTLTDATGTKTTETVKFNLAKAAADSSLVVVQPSSALALIIKDPTLFGTYKQGAAYTLNLEAV